jgi:hypothetical protein
LARRLKQAKNKKTSEKGDFMFPNSAVTKVNDSNPQYGCYAVLKRVPSGDYRLQIATEAFSDQLYPASGSELVKSKQMSIPAIITLALLALALVLFAGGLHTQL